MFDMHWTCLLDLEDIHKHTHTHRRFLGSNTIRKYNFCLFTWKILPLKRGSNQQLSLKLPTLIAGRRGQMSTRHRPRAEGVAWRTGPPAADHSVQSRGAETTRCPCASFMSSHVFLCGQNKQTVNIRRRKAANVETFKCFGSFFGRLVLFTLPLKSLGSRRNVLNF